MSRKSIAFATDQQVAKAIVAPATVKPMDEQKIQEWRIQRLAALANEEGGKAALGRRLGYKDGAFVGQMLRGERPVTEKTVNAIHALQGYANWFAGEGQQSKVAHAAGLSPTPSPGAPVVHVPILANAASMGTGIEQGHEDVIIGVLPLSELWMRRTLQPTSVKHVRFIHAHGDSMSPTFEDGDIVLVDTGMRDARSIDGIYVIKANERLYIKRVRQRIDGIVEISSDNPTVKTVDELDGERPLSVLGKVIYRWLGKKL